MPAKYKLGKHKKKEDKRNLKAAKYIDYSKLPPLPTLTAYGHGNLIVAWLMYLNDMLGDCVIAGAYHFLMLINIMAGRAFSATDRNAEETYELAAGYNPADSNTDQGTNMLDFLKYWKNTGIKDASGNIHKIRAFVEIEPGNLQELLYAIYLFGGAYIGVQLPSSAESQFENNEMWSIVPSDTTVGGHCLYLVSKQASPIIDAISWAKDQQATVEWILKYMDEGYIIFDDEMFNNLVTMDGFKYDDLLADLNLVGTLPSPTPPTSTTWYQRLIEWFKDFI